MIHSAQGTQFTSLAFTRRAQESGLLPSVGSIGGCFDNAVIESFLGRMQTELLKRQRCRTRIESASAIFEYVEIFHKRPRRHSPRSSMRASTPVHPSHDRFKRPHRAEPRAHQRLHQTQGGSDIAADPLGKE